MIRRPPRSTRKESSAASDVYKRQLFFKQKTAYEIAQCLVGSEMCIRDSRECGHAASLHVSASSQACLLYTSDAADDSLRVDLGGRRIIKKNFLCRRRG
ncbi:hypothetical protein [Staphylococcus aureus]